MEDDLQLSNKSKPLLVSVVVTAIVGVTAITLILLKGGPEAVEHAAILIGFVTPITGGLLAFMVRGIHVDLNSRLSQLLEESKKAAHAEGKVQGIEQAKAELSETKRSTD